MRDKDKLKNAILSAPIIIKQKREPRFARPNDIQKYEPAFTEQTLNHIIATRRDELLGAGILVKVGRYNYIELQLFRDWVANGSATLLSGTGKKGNGKRKRNSQNLRASWPVND